MNLYNLLSYYNFVFTTCEVIQIEKLKNRIYNIKIILPKKITIW